MMVHPEVGKWLIALGEQAFGMDPFGWRIAAAVVGSLMVLVMCRLARRLTGSTVLGCVAGLLLGFDGLHFVLSRLALLDIFLAFFLLCAVACARQRPRLVPRAAGAPGPRPQPGPDAWGPVRGLLFRPWLLTAGICFGLAVGTKWTAVYPLAAFGLLVWAWSAGARRSFGVRWATLSSAVVDGVPAFVQLVLVGFVVYVASWTGWLAHADEYEEHLSSTQYTGFIRENPCVPVEGGEPGEMTTDNDSDDAATWPTAREPDATGLGEVVQSLRSLWYYHQDVYVFHTHYLNCSTHTYQSQPSGWLLINRPVGVATDLEIQPGDEGLRGRRGQRLLPAGAADRHPHALVGRRARDAGGRRPVARRPRLALRGGGGRDALDLAALAALRRPADLLLLRDRVPAVHGARDHPRARQADRPLDPALGPTHHRRHRRRVVLRAGGA